LEDSEIILHVEVQTRGSTHETRVLWSKRKAHMKPASRLHTENFSKFWDLNASLINETRVQKSQDAEPTGLALNS